MIRTIFSPFGYQESLSVLSFSDVVPILSLSNVYLLLYASVCIYDVCFCVYYAASVFTYEFMSLYVPHLCLHLSVITHLLNVCLYCSTYVQVFVFKKTCLFYLLVYLSLAYFFGFCLLVSLVTISTNLLSSVQLNSSGAIYLLMGYKKKYIWPSNLQLHGLLALVGNIANKLSWSPGIVVMGGDSWSEGCGLESQQRMLDGHFLTQTTKARMLYQSASHLTKFAIRNVTYQCHRTNSIPMSSFGYVPIILLWLDDFILCSLFIIGVYSGLRR